MLQKIPYAQLLNLGIDLSLHAAKTPNRTMDGPFAAWATKDDFVWYTIPTSGTLNQGQPVVIDVTQLGPNASPAQAEYCIPNSNSNSTQLCVGVYQGAAQTNPSASVTKRVLIQVRQQGYGQVYAGAIAAGVAVTVGGALSLDTTHDFAIQTAASQPGAAMVGYALATGSTTAKGATLITVPGSGSTTLLVNAFIQTFAGA